MSLNDLFEALKALIIPFITRFEKLERRLNEIEESEAYTSGIAEELQGDQLDDRLSRVERKLGDESDLERLAERVGYIHEEARDYFCRVESLEDQMEAHDGYWSHFEPKVNRLEGELQDALSRDNGLSARVDALESDVKRLEHSARHMEFDRIDSLEREVGALTDLVREQDKTIKALLKALEWEPPKD